MLHDPQWVVEVMRKPKPFPILSRLPEPDAGRGAG